MPSPSEEEQADHARVEYAFRAYADDLYQYIYSKVGNAALAEDLRSTVFLKAFRWLNEERTDESIRGWLYATARTTIADYWQKHGQIEQLPIDMLENVAARDVEREEASAAYIQVQRLLQLLPPRERDILTLRYLRGFSTVEIAHIVGTSTGNVRVMQLRALRHAASLEATGRSILMTQSQQPQQLHVEMFIKATTEETKRVFDLAREEALALHHTFIGTEHILLGLLREGSMTPLLTDLGTSYERLRGGVIFLDTKEQPQFLYGERKLPAEGHPLHFLTPRSIKVFTIAVDEAKRLGEKQIRPAHILLAILREGEGVAAILLQSLDVRLEQVRFAVEHPTEPVKERLYTCSFCNQPGDKVQRIFPSMEGFPRLGNASAPAFICDVCVTRFSTMLSGADGSKTDGGLR
jgi:RNA polymerase sigma factor (sigma-70 family)